MGSGLARRTELIELGRVKVPVVMTHREGVLLTEAVKVICHGTGSGYALTERDQGGWDTVENQKLPSSRRPSLMDGRKEENNSGGEDLVLVKGRQPNH